MRREALEHVGLLSDVDVVGIGEGAIGIGLRALEAEQPDDPFPLRRHRREQQRVDDGEGCAVRADAEGEDKDCHRGEARRLGERANGITKVLQQA